MKAWRDKLEPLKIVFSEPYENWIDEYEPVHVIPEADHAAQQAVLAKAEKLLAEIAAKYNTGYPHITHVIGQSAERIRDEIRELKKVNEEAV